MNVHTHSLSPLTTDMHTNAHSHTRTHAPANTKTDAHTSGLREYVHKSRYICTYTLSLSYPHAPHKRILTHTPANIEKVTNRSGLKKSVKQYTKDFIPPEKRYWNFGTGASLQLTQNRPPLSHHYKYHYCSSNLHYGLLQPLSHSSSVLMSSVIVLGCCYFSCYGVAFGLYLGGRYTPVSSGISRAAADSAIHRRCSKETKGTPAMNRQNPKSNAEYPQIPVSLCLRSFGTTVGNIS